MPPRHWTNLYSDKEVKPLSRHRTHLKITDRIWDALVPPTEFGLWFIYGKLGYGKSAYSIFALVEILMNWYNLKEKVAWELSKQYIVFHPEQFFNKLDEIENLGLGRIPALDWDDAGLWLYALDWNDPFIKSFGKWLNVARTTLAGLMLTTPTPKVVVKKVRNLPDAYRIKMIKHTSAPRTLWLRRAKIYEEVDLPDMRKSQVYLRSWDNINIYIPDKFYKWYKPLRDHYERIARGLMKKSMDKKRGKYKDAIMVPDLADHPEIQVPKMLDPRDFSI